MSALSHLPSHELSQVSHCCPRPRDSFGTGSPGVFCGFLETVPTVPRSRHLCPAGTSGTAGRVGYAGQLGQVGQLGQIET